MIGEKKIMNSHLHPKKSLEIINPGAFLCDIIKKTEVI